MGTLVMIVVLILPFTFVVAIEWMKSKERQKRYDLQADLYAKALEKGEPIPTDAFTKLESKENKLSVGIILITIGIGLALSLWLLSMSGPFAVIKSTASLGIIPFLIGIALILIHFIEKKKNTGENAQ